MVINGDIYLGTTKLYCGTKSIIDDVLVQCSNIAFILVYFECVCKLLKKSGSTSDKINATSCLTVEYIGHDRQANGNCTVKSKFGMIND